VSGIGYIDQDLDSATSYDLFDVVIPGLPPMDPPPGEPSFEKTSYKRANIYAYSQIRMLDPLVLTLGLSATALERGNHLERDQINPKLGLIWQALPGTMIRATAFRQLANSRFFTQTIEQTQIAGFNQFFDDYEGTD
jgi:hypothetical protein